MSENNGSTDRRLTETEGCRHLNVHAVEWAWSRAMGRLPGTQLLVLLAIAKHVGKGTDTCTPGHRHLAYEAGVSVSSVERAVPALEAAGWIKTEHRGRQKGGGRSSDRYWLMGYFPVKMTDNSVDKVDLSPQGDGKGGEVTRQSAGDFPLTVTGDRSTEVGSTKKPAAATSSSTDHVPLSTASGSLEETIANHYRDLTPEHVQSAAKEIRRLHPEVKSHVAYIAKIFRSGDGGRIDQIVRDAKPASRACNCTAPAPPPEMTDDPNAYAKHLHEWVCPRHRRAAA